MPGFLSYAVSSRGIGDSAGHGGTGCTGTDGGYPNGQPMSSSLSSLPLNGSIQRAPLARSQTLGFLGRSRGATPCLRRGSACSTTSSEVLDDFGGDRAAGGGSGGTASSSSAAAPGGAAGERRAGAEFRLRFFNFNMGNNSNYSHVKDLQGPGGRGSFVDTLRDPLADGGEADIVFVTLVETRVNLSEWSQQYSGQQEDGLDTLLVQNARREGKHYSRSRVRGWVETLAASYNGNLKSMLAFADSSFKEDTCSQLFGRLIEARVAGVPVPNPKKAFIGRSIRKCVDDIGVRFTFVSSHFPVTKLAAALEDKAIDQLHGAKVALARSLRKVLRKATTQGIADGNTILFLQGDLNSRTVLRHEAEENEYKVTLVRLKTKRLGLELGFDDATSYRGGAALLVTHVRGGVVDQWNQEHPSEQVRVGDVVVEVNGIRGDNDVGEHMMKQFKESQHIELRLHRKVSDVLLEVLRDDDMQEAIQHELGLPPGRWHEIAHYEIVHDLPVTYKFLDHVACGSSASSVGSPSCRAGGRNSGLAGPEQLPFPLTVGDIISCQSMARAASGVIDDTTFDDPDSPTRSKKPTRNASQDEVHNKAGPQGNELYRAHLTNMGEKKLAEYGLVYKKNDFRAFRFPACADRVLFWAADTLSDRMSFELPQEGYEVNHSQLGSDHRPVTLEVVLQIAPDGHAVRNSQRPSRQANQAVVETIGAHLASERESEDEGEETPGSKTGQEPAVHFP